MLSTDTASIETENVFYRAPQPRLPLAPEETEKQLNLPTREQ